MDMSNYTCPCMNFSKTKQKTLLKQDISHERIDPKAGSHGHSGKDSEGHSDRAGRVWLSGRFYRPPSRLPHNLRLPVLMVSHF